MDTSEKLVTSPVVKGGPFSPVDVAKSPVSKIGQKGNLTGLPRTVRDGIAAIYNLIQQWNKEHIEGCHILSKLSDVKKTKINTEKKDDNCESLQLLCDLLERPCIVMSDIAYQLDHYADSLVAVQRLDDLRHQDRGPLFLTWPLSQFVETAKLIANAYNMEASTKRLVLRRVARSKDESTLIFYVSTWIHQPFISFANLNLKLEAALLETGLR